MKNNFPYREKISFVLLELLHAISTSIKTHTQKKQHINMHINQIFPIIKQLRQAYIVFSDITTLVEISENIV